ncbi:MAG: DUF3040 domain-containing protein [Actinomycetales bacterium]|nr:DUF3040 domain-containing protein [Actinomycetales bacterium]
MALSEHEQRLLEQMEKALYAEDPKFATSLRSPGLGRASRGRAALGVFGVILGMGVMLAGVAVPLPALGVLGFAIMLVSAVIAYAAFRAPAASVEGEAEQPGPAPKQARTRSPFMDRMEDRWRKRQGEGEL